MSFLVCLISGMFLGLVLAVLFARHQNTRSLCREALAEMVSAFAKMTIHDSKKLIPNQFYPSWVVFSRMQKLTWLNGILEKMWPYINQATSELIRSSVEPILEQYRPMILASLTFSKLTLGTVAPQFTGIRITEEDSGNGGVTMELEMQWDGNPNIVLDVKTRFGVSLPIQVKNIGFTGVFRLIFKPFVDEFPCFAAVSYSLRKKVKLDFTLKIIGGEISAIPGISDAIEETIRDAIEDSITWPVRKIVQILPGDYSDLELKPVGVLDVKLVQAKNLTNKDMIGKSDPYAVLFVRPLPDRTKTSRIINNNLNPIWNESFEFIVEDAETQHLTVRIFDDEGVQASEFIGCAQVELKDVEPGKVKVEWLKLVKDLDVRRDNKYRGEVHLELLYIPYGSKSSIKNPVDQEFQLTTLEKVMRSGDGEGIIAQKSNVIVRGVLSVTVVAAENLPTVDLMGSVDPFVVLSMKKTDTRAKTRVIVNNKNPVWNQRFDFVVEDALHDLLIAEVWDHDTFGKDKIGRCIMTLTKVLLEEEYQEKFPLECAKSGYLFLHIKWTPQLKVRET